MPPQLGMTSTTLPPQVLKFEKKSASAFERNGRISACCHDRVSDYNKLAPTCSGYSLPDFIFLCTCRPGVCYIRNSVTLNG